MNIMPYGDVLNDGIVQISFTLPVAESAKAKEAARLFVLELGFESCEVVHSEALADGYTFFLVYGETNKSIDLDKVKVDEHLKEGYLNFQEINDFIKDKIGRKIVIAGACTGSDAHTVCLDAIMNMKGYNHHYGLERYPMIQSHNLGAQVPNVELIEFAKKVKADAILVSQVVTQRDIHIANMTNFIELLNKEGIRDDFIIVAGGPKITNKLATELGFDAGFGRGTYAEHVGTFIVRQIANKDK
ncbi:MAG: OAM dimerization domain-containing protein [Candidatus Paceibacteria bacterium]